MKKVQVEILSKKLVKPSTPTPDCLRVYKLSFLDQLAPPRYATLLSFYQADGTVDAAKTASRIEQLEKSLSEIVSCYYPLPGRLTADLLSVECQDQGVPFMVAKISCQLHEFLKEGYHDIDLLSIAAPKCTDDLANAAPVEAQISMFECGGLVVCLNTLHAVVDGLTAATFFTEWAKMSNSGICQAKLTSFNSGSVFPAFSNMKTSLPRIPGEQIVTKRLLFDGAAIQNLKDQVMASHSGLGRQPSKVEVITAFIWSALIRAARARYGYLRPSMTSLSVNLRGKTDGVVPENAFGNMYVPVPIKFMADESMMELHHFVQLIHNAMQKYLADCAKASRDDLASMITRAHSEMQEWHINDEVDARFASSLCKFPVYEADFGWGKPSWVTIPKFPIQMFMLMDTKCGTGIEGILSLNEMEMQKLEYDSCMAPFLSPKNPSLQN